MNANLITSIIPNWMSLTGSLLAAPFLMQEVTVIPQEEAPATAQQHGAATRVVYGKQATAAWSTMLPAAVSNRIDLAICLDTSGSMDNLIDAARQKIWTIVNDFALAEPQPRLRVAVLSFGNDGDDPSQGWVRIAQPLTDDLDLVSMELFALKTNGGTELVGRVVQAARTQLDWTSEPGALKVMVVAGNESAEQDQVVFAGDASSAAIAAGIQVNTLYCGGAVDADAAGWNAVARLADGFYAAIDPGQIDVIASPFDGRLAELSGDLNGTYVPIGAQGQWAWINQRAQDSNAVNLNSAAAASRAQSKAGKLYRNSWDLIDGYNEGTVKIEELEKKELPEELRVMTVVELETHIKGCDTKRKKVQEEIQDLSTQRSAWLESERLRRNESDENSFDATIRRGVQAQATAKGFRFKQRATAVTREASDANAASSTAPAAGSAPATVGATNNTPVGAGGSSQLRVPLPRPVNANRAAGFQQTGVSAGNSQQRVVPIRQRVIKPTQQEQQVTGGAQSAGGSAQSLGNQQTGSRPAGQQTPAPKKEGGQS
ncbi:MAG: hypothetical protein ACI841_002261 [Planctomycetota bacterium]|jgi:hypothetical protein